MTFNAPFTAISGVKPTFFFDPFLQHGQQPDTATHWLLRRTSGVPIGHVEQMADSRFKAHRNGTFIGSYPTKHAAGVALDRADKQEAGV